MARLMNLPTELLQTIFAYFDPVQDRTLLVALCKVSRRTYEVAQPLLVRHFASGLRCISCNTLDCTDGPWEECQLQSLIQFTRTTIARPDLGVQVRRLTIEEHTCTQDAMDQWPSVLTAETIKHYISAIQKLKVKNKSQFASAIAGCIFGPFLIILISQTPNVEMVSIVLDWNRMTSFLVLSRQMLRSSSGWPCLANLKSLDINCYDKKPIELQRVVPILTLPRLQEVSIAYCAGSSEVEWPDNILPGDLKLSTISLSPAGIDAECLTRLVSACAHLKRFAYVAMEYSWVDGIGPPEIQRALDSQRQNLEELRIEYRHAWNGTIVDPNTCPKYGSFQNFTNVKRLELEQAFIMPASKLPPSLEVLVIRQSDYPIFDMMAELVSACRTTLPPLREIVIEPYALAPYAIIGLYRYWSADYFASNEGFWTAFASSYQRLEKIFEGTAIKLVVDCDAWYRYKLDDECKVESASHNEAMKKKGCLGP
ncbi:hypothetical protein PHISCL_06084 [Aspergillus sclerotialis]|uniref:F-box domain-containing protein n=1 Tax=Aspergillus sclerotialis TaxID=2070753 RepID=A0A3A2ZUC7_9EURO|nr:hypothetical protein PHISCL_06084 [Aspergillus sclerotialis]